MTNALVSGNKMMTKEQVIAMAKIEKLPKFMVDSDACKDALVRIVNAGYLAGAEAMRERAAIVCGNAEIPQRGHGWNIEDDGECALQNAQTLIRVIGPGSV